MELAKMLITIRAALALDSVQHAHGFTRKDAESL
jgi:hypothetical protein